MTRRKLLPSLYNLAADGILPDDFAIIGVARREWTREVFIQQLREALPKYATRNVDPALWSKFEERIHFCRGSFENSQTYEKLKALLSECEKQHHTGGNALFYLSVQPVSFATIAQQLSANGLVTETPTAWRRVIIEKPFGRDLASARDLTSALSSALPERQIYRIDHYLGKSVHPVKTAQEMRGNSQILRRLCSGDARRFRSYGTQHLPAVLVSATTRLSRNEAKGMDSYKHH